MTRYDVYVKKTNQRMTDSQISDEDSLYKIGEAEAENADAAIKKVVRQNYSPQIIQNEFNLMEDEAAVFAAVAQRNVNTEVARISRDGQEFEFGKIW